MKVDGTVLRVVLSNVGMVKVKKVIPVQAMKALRVSSG
jgi:hypothetical protein